MGAVVAITLAQLPAAVRNAPAAMRQAIARGTLVGAERSRGIMVRRTPVDQGQLKASWHVRPGFEATLAELANDAPHAGIVELGARPHGVSPEGWAAIYEWVRRHPELYVRSGSATNPAWQGPNRPRMRRPAKVMGPLGPYQGADPDIAAVTNAICRKLQRVGQKPTYFVRDSVDDCARATTAEIAHALEQLANDTARTGGQ